MNHLIQVPSFASTLANQVEQRYRLETEERKTLPLHKIVRQFNVLVHNEKAKEEKERNFTELKPLAQRIETLSTEKIDYYHSTCFRKYVIELFSTIRNYFFGTGELESAGLVGKELSEEVYRLAKDEEVLRKSLLNLAPEPTATTLFSGIESLEDAADTVVEASDEDNEASETASMVSAEDNDFDTIFEQTIKNENYEELEQMENEGLEKEETDVESHETADIVKESKKEVEEETK